MRHSMPPTHQPSPKRHRAFLALSLKPGIVGNVCYPAQTHEILNMTRRSFINFGYFFRRAPLAANGFGVTLAGARPHLRPCHKLTIFT